jgi:hypothetical protein
MLLSLRARVRAAADWRSGSGATSPNNFRRTRSAALSERKRNGPRLVQSAGLDERARELRADVAIPRLEAEKRRENARGGV